MAHVTIPDQDTFVTYPITSSTTGPFLIPFPIFAKADLTCLIDGEDIGQAAFSYTPTSSTTGGYQTGTISLGSARENCELTIYRSILPVRTSDMGPGPKDRDADNTQWDRFQAQLQDIRRDLARAFKGPLGTSPVDFPVDGLADLANIIADISTVAGIADEVVAVADHINNYYYASTYGFGRSGNTPAQNSAALQIAITAAAGKTLWLPDRWVEITASTAAACATIPAAGITLKSLGGPFTSGLRISAGVGAVALAAVDADNVVIDGVGFDGQAETGIAWQRGVVLRGVRNCAVRNCYFYRLGNGPIGFGTEGFHGSDQIGNGTRRCERIVVEGNVLLDNWGTVAIITKYNGAADISVTGNTIINSCNVGISIESEDNLSYTVFNYWAERAVVSNNIIYNLDYLHSTVPTSDVAYGISISESVRYITVTSNVISTISGNTLACGIQIGTSPTQSDETVYGVTIVGNAVANITAVGGRGHGIYLGVGDTNIDAVSIAGNAIYGGKDGITLVTAASTKTLGTVNSLAISANVIRGATEFGIWSDTTSGSGEVAVNAAAISGNSIGLCGSHGVIIYVTNSSFTGNTIFGCGGAGISFVAGSKGNALSGNTITDNSGNGLTGDLTNANIGPNTIMRNGQTQASGYGVYATSGTGITIQGCTSGGDGAPGLAKGTTAANVAYQAFKYYIGGAEYSLAASAAAGIAPGNDVIPLGKYGCVAFEVGTDGVVDVIEAAANSTGYNTAALAVAGLPAKQASHVRFGNVTAMKSDGTFTFGTTALDAANTTVAYTSAIQDYGFRSANNGQTVRNNNFAGNALATIFGNISNHNTTTYDAGLNRTV